MYSIRTRDLDSFFFGYRQNFLENLSEPSPSTVQMILKRFGDLASGVAKRESDADGTTAVIVILR